MRLVLLAAFVSIFLVAFSFAGSCPAGAGDCFLCGGVNGIPCASTDSCKGKVSPGFPEGIACACPQGEPCACYCPYSQYGSKASAPVTAQAGCPSSCAYGCSSDGSICLNKQASEIEGSGPAEITYANGEVFVRKPGAGWAKVKGPLKLDENYEIRTGPGAKADLKIYDSTFYIRGDSILTVKEFMPPPGPSKLRILVEVVRGFIYCYLTPNPELEQIIRGGSWGSGVKGTKYLINATGPNDATLKVYDGTVEFWDKTGKPVPVNESQMAVVRNGVLSGPYPFDPSKDDTPFQGGCCGSAAIMLSTLAFVLFKL